MPMSPHRPALAGILLAILAVLVFQSPTASAVGPNTTASTNPIAATALTYEGTFEGDCWPFVKQVVFEATGREIGFDYRQGFFDAGAVEVSLAEAQSGDIIQVANDANTSPTADYAGLHTSIIIRATGPGVFDVIDSNSQWDGMVRWRLAYDPTAAAGRYPGLAFHIYRISGSSPATTAPPLSPAVATRPLQPGDRATVKTPGDCLNLRVGPGTDQALIKCLPDRTVVTALSAPLASGGRQWIKVSTFAGEGWVAVEFLSAPSAGPAGTGDTKPLLPYRAFVPAVAAN
jgi:hypothetical protein